MTTLDCVIQLVQETGVEGWSCGETWESIKFPEGYEKPPKEEFEAKLKELMTVHYLKELRQERNRRLAEVDWVFSSDYHISSEERDVWVAYRQALRDLPSVTEDPTNPVWPTKPPIPKGTTLNVDLKSINDEEVSENAQIVLLQNVVFSLTKRIEALENA